MAKRRFHPGDRVRHFIGGPVMQVLHYEQGKGALLGLLQGNSKVVCTWQVGHHWEKKAFDQDALIKLGDRPVQPNQPCSDGRYLNCREMN